MLHAVAGASRSVGKLKGRPITALLHAGSDVEPRPWVGCSHWQTPFRPIRHFASNDSAPSREPRLRKHDETVETDPSMSESRDPIYTPDSVDEGAWTAEGITVDQVDTDALEVLTASMPGAGTPNDSQSKNAAPSPSVSASPGVRPTLPTSIKKLNRLLSHDRSMTIPDSDLIEKFVKGRGPGGQAINKTNSSVSLIHIPTGIRVQSQPTRSREENRKIARKIMAERLDLIRARATATITVTGTGTGVGESEDVGHADTAAAAGGQSRKEKEKQLAGQWSRDEIRWEKERRRKLNKAKKAKKKHGKGDEGSGGI